MNITTNDSVIAKDEQAGTANSCVDHARKLSGTDPKARKAPAATNAKPNTKAATVLKLLRSKKGVSIAQLTAATGWQAHSVRGFLSGTVKKKLGLVVVSEVGKDDVRRYRLDVNTTVD